MRKTSRTVNCAYCNKTLIRIPARIREHNYCNTSCQMKYEYAHGRTRKPHDNLYKAHKEKCSGDKYWNWKGGNRKWKSPFDFYYNVEWNELRAKVYKRDNWTCQICGVHCGRKNKIQCHHIVPYRITQDNSEANLITLCVTCHRREEVKYYRIKE